MAKKISMIAMCAVLAFCFFSCSTSENDSSDTSLSVSLPGKAVYTRDDAQTFVVSISSSRHSDSKSASIGETVTFSSVPVGEYKVTIEGKNSSGATVAKGVSYVTVVANETAVASVTVNPLSYYTVTFDLNGIGMVLGDNVEIPSQTVIAGECATKPSGTPRYDDAETGVFVCWSTIPNECDPVIFSSTPITADTTFYAYASSGGTIYCKVSALARISSSDLNSLYNFLISRNDEARITISLTDDITDSNVSQIIAFFNKCSDKRFDLSARNLTDYSTQIEAGASNVRILD